MMVRPDEDVLLGLLPFYHIYGLVIVQCRELRSSYCANYLHTYGSWYQND